MSDKPHIERFEKELELGAIRVDLIAYPHKLLSAVEANELMLRQREALRELLESMEAESSAHQSKGGHEHG